MITERDVHIYTQQYLRAMALFVLYYAFTVSPNIYTAIVVIVLTFTSDSSNIGLFILTLLIVAAAPVASYFLSLNYVIMNMLTYFPYANNREEWQYVVGYCIPWITYLGYYSLQFLVQRKYGSVTACTRYIRRFRGGLAV
ncbi:hypothetical protein GMRT_10872 [Giardia muris]|uniref:Uncharacterized protein n=1 Tax=Giardia muris TaxID=5742 RepID=A0A4Z1SS70_GIAMU|nr:hypothetical protein GMRT_10872 [Giardia muris]|eukprot:TNJ28610.1 hypothetical protein GMRT_10872 [Giardia muris]